MMMHDDDDDDDDDDYCYYYYWSGLIIMDSPSRKGVVATLCGDSTRIRERQGIFPYVDGSEESRSRFWYVRIYLKLTPAKPAIRRNLSPSKVKCKDAIVTFVTQGPNYFKTSDK